MPWCATDPSLHDSMYYTVSSSTAISMARVSQLEQISVPHTCIDAARSEYLTSTSQLLRQSAAMPVADLDLLINHTYRISVSITVEDFTMHSVQFYRLHTQFQRLTQLPPSGSYFHPKPD